MASAPVDASGQHRRPKTGLHLSNENDSTAAAGPNKILSPPSPGQLFPIPSPIITRRTRTYSATERARANPTLSGKIKSFCRHKGHGYLTPDNSSDEIFVHVSDVEGEYVPKEGDEVTFKLCPIPPKNERSQAIHVEILNMTEETHERWDSPSPVLGTPGAQSPGSPFANSSR